MANVDEIIDYIRSLRKGFDKDLFQSKIYELADAVDTIGLDYDDFHTLFKIWLNLSIPITKWVSLGSCLVPSVMVRKKTVEYCLRWILANFENRLDDSRIGFLLDWLTAAMECESIDMKALDMGYEVFYTMLTSEVLTVHAVKLIYTLTKPADVTRGRVLEIIEYARTREGKKNLYRQLQVLLGLFKSYKPECVPEDIPAISILTAFKKINVNLITRFRKNKENQNEYGSHMKHLSWTQQTNFDSGRNKKANPLMPSLEFNRMMRRTDNQEPMKTAMDFTDAVSVIRYGSQHAMCRPARLRSFLCNAAGQVLLALMPRSQHEFLSCDLHHLLNTCFLEVSPYSYAEKQNLLLRLAMFQRTLSQGIPVITSFLAQYLSMWNEKDHFAEILELAEWVSVDNPQHIQVIIQTLSKVYLRAQPMEQCAILRTLTKMYTNMVYSSSKEEQVFLTGSSADYSTELTFLAKNITRLCSLGLQTDPEDFRILYTTLQSHRQCASAQAQLPRGSLPALPGLLPLALPLLTTSEAALDCVAELLYLYKSILKSSNGQDKTDIRIDTLNKYMSDVLNCLYSEEAFSGRNDGLIFVGLNPKIVDKLTSLIPNVNGQLSIRNHLTFAPYYLELLEVDRNLTNKELFHSFIEPTFSYLGMFLKKALPELQRNTH